MFNWFSRWRSRRIIARSTISTEQWQSAFSQLPVLNRLTTNEKQRLKDLAVLFLYEKSIEGARGCIVDDAMRLLIALQACLPVLKLDLSWYKGWVSVIVYPGAFLTEQKFIDESGVVHTTNQALGGEAWLRGPVILAWDDTAHAGYIDGQNLVIHEFAHKLDMMNGVANGFPPLHSNINKHEWSEVFSAAFSDFRKNLHNKRRAGIDHYGATNPGEFFAVLSEVFFEMPQVIHQYYPSVYDNLVLFYRQNPLETGV